MPTRTRPHRRLISLVLALLGLGISVAPFPGAAQAQTAAGGASLAEFDLSADQFGVGNTARAGGWVGIRVRFRDNTDRPRDVLLQIELRDADGDRPVYRRVVTANPGRWQQSWLYVHLPYRFEATRGLRLSAREVSGENAAVPGLDSGDSSAGTRTGVRAGRLIAEAVAMPGQVVTDYEGLLGIIGDATHGLSLYGQSHNGGNFSPLSHERTEVVSRIAPLDLPDRWLGLAPFEVLVWAGGDPAELGAERSRSLREWIERGGHLVIVLTVENQGPWTTSQNNLLRDLFPAVEVRATEGVDLDRYRHLITRDPNMGLPRNALVHAFEPLASAGPQEAMRILDGPDGESVVVRRLVGNGAVTVVGMGVGTRVLSNVGLPAADVFWNRVLGWRGQVEPLTRLNDLNSVLGYSLSNRGDPTVLDRDIESNINLIGQSLAGVVLAFAVFGLYWLVAGPGGFAVLKKAGHDRHAWVGFVAAAALFTGIAWGGATIIKPKRVEVRHVTILDHVYGQEVDRARSWMSILVPSYLGAEVSVGGEGLTAGIPRFYEAISPWEGRPDAALAATGGSFPDARAYDVESRAPESLRVPTRATVKQFQVEWAGAPRIAWPTPAFTSGDGSNAITLDPVSGLPVGVLTHNLPVPLTNVQVIVVRRQQTLRRFGAGSWVGSDGRAVLLSPLSTWTTDAISVKPLNGTWDPGTPLDLLPMFESVSAASRPLAGWLDRAGGRDGITERLAYASFIHQFAPPALNQTSPLLQRIATHGFDLSRWFSQPCVIVLGTLEMTGREAMPIPIGVSVGNEDRTLYAEGRTLIRWIYPLPPAPPAWPSTSTPETASDDGESELTPTSTSRPGRATQPAGRGRPPG